MFGELLIRQRLTRDFWDLCSALNLAPSRNTLNSRADSVLTQLQEDINLGVHDLVLLLFDNVGFSWLSGLLRPVDYDEHHLLKQGDPPGSWILQLCLPFYVPLSSAYSLHCAAHPARAASPMPAITFPIQPYCHWIRRGPRPPPKSSFSCGRLAAQSK